MNFDENGKCRVGCFTHIKGSYCSNCKKYFGETLERWSPSRYESWLYRKCTHCQYEWDDYAYYPTGGSGPGDIDDLRPTPEPIDHYIKEGEPKRFTKKRFDELRNKIFPK